jgi:hypothetical protein
LIPGRAKERFGTFVNYPFSERALILTADKEQNLWPSDSSITLMRLKWSGQSSTFGLRLKLFEKLFINLLDMKCIFDAASNIMPDHQTRELIPVY